MFKGPEAGDPGGRGSRVHGSRGRGARRQGNQGQGIQGKGNHGVGDPGFRGPKAEDPGGWETGRRGSCGDMQNVSSATIKLVLTFQDWGKFLALNIQFFCPQQYLLFILFTTI